MLLEKFASLTALEPVHKIFDDVAKLFLRSPGFVQGVVWFVVIIFFKYPDIAESPVWDSAMGVFPPAIYLYEKNFSILNLIKESGWWAGGPNVHSLSLLPWIIAFIFKLTDTSTATFYLVHVMIFAAVAWSLFLYTRILLAYQINALSTIAAALAVLLMPFVLVQVGYMYEEILVLVLSVAAWDSWRRDKTLLTVLFCIFCITIKLTGVAIAISVLIAAVFSPRQWKISRVAVLGLIPLYICLYLLLPGWLGRPTTVVGSWDNSSFYFNALIRTLQVPDLALVLFLALFSNILIVSRYIYPFRSKKNILVSSPVGSSKIVLVVMPFVFLFGVLFQLYNEMLFLVRYMVPVIPFAICGFLLHTKQIEKHRYGTVFLLVFIVFSLINTNGKFYFPKVSAFSVVERSHAYRDFHKLQKDLLLEIEKIPISTPIYVTREIWYMASNPLMGYLDKKMPNIRPIFRSDYVKKELHEYPREFVLILSNAGHGGQQMIKIHKSAVDSDSYVVNTHTYEHQGFRGQVVKISMKN